MMKKQKIDSEGELSMSDQSNTDSKHATLHVHSFMKLISKIGEAQRSDHVRLVTIANRMENDILNMVNSNFLTINELLWDKEEGQTK